MKEKKNTKIKNRKVINLLILAISVTIITAYAISNTRAQETTTEETTENTDKVVWVESTEADEEGNILKVPVPVGYTASQVPGETTVSGGFVIYEGEIDWSKIVIEEEEEETTTETESTETETETQSETENEVATASFSLEDSTGETNTEEEINTTEDNSVNQENNETEDNTNTDENNEIENNVENTIEATSFNLSNNQEETETTENQEETESVATEETQEITTYSTDSTETTETEESITLLELQSTVNQYVWVPINDVSEIYGVDENGKIWGKLYKYNTTGRTALNWTEENGIIKITSSRNYREPVAIRSLTEYDIDSSLQSNFDGANRYELLCKKLEQEYYEIVKSIKKYGGFYIGRYEMGESDKTYPTNAVIQKGRNANGVSWYTIYESCKALSGQNDNVFTYMVTGALWDATLQWFVNSGATNSFGNTITYELLANSTTWGNCKNATFEYVTADGDIVTKDSGTGKKIPTGSTEYTKVNNIYDMAGNEREWRTDVLYDSNRTGVGNYWGMADCAAAGLYFCNPEWPYAGRAILLIK